MLSSQTPVSLTHSRPKAIVIAGPTASGKSALALAIAAEFHGTIINADSQQCYGDLPLLTARPTSAETSRAPHRLFGDLGPLAKDSAPAWAARAAMVIAESTAIGSPPIVAGGTGLYLQALMAGMPDMPSIPSEVRDAARALLMEIGHGKFHARLAVRDPAGAERIKTGDTQRLLRAWEVAEATGRPLSAWQADTPHPPLAADYLSILLMPARADVVTAGDERFDRMMACGALEEVAALLGRGIPPTAPVMRVLGARPLARHLAGEIERAEAITLAKTATRQYAKRQSTWFRHQLFAETTYFTKYSESLLPEVFSKIRRFLLT
ncbi:MAG: tRNA (adenosine(37)-N6)-dimethylallyltransferase MiaA [Rhodospirillaceae bacterium]|nr:MAG: tRNA (adenosine(37)-N6)-dimethylallyltransferase MiaA [Rhodospirillaceae bacterium]